MQFSGVAVSGVGVVTSLGTEPDAVRDSCLRGESGVQPWLQPDGTALEACQAHAPAPDLDLAPRLRQPKSVKLMNRSSRSAVWAALDAFEQSGLDSAAPPSERLAVHAGSGEAGLEPEVFFPAFAVTEASGPLEFYDRLGPRSVRMIDRLFPIRTLANAAGGLVSAEIGARGSGTNYVQSADSSALALASACQELEDGLCDAALAIGCDSLLDPSTYLAYRGMDLLSPSAADKAFRPFDQDRNGLVLGEGAGVLVLERAEDIRQRQGRVLGWILGVGCASDLGDSMNPTDPAATARAAIEQLGLEAPPAVVVAHGIGSQAGDSWEARALHQVFGGDTPVTALKGHTGYVGAATAIVETSLILASLRSGCIPPIANCITPDPDFRLELVHGSARPALEADPVAVVVSWSWTGQCSAVAVRAATESDAVRPGAGGRM